MLLKKVDEVVPEPHSLCCVGPDASEAVKRAVASIGNTLIEDVVEMQSTCWGLVAVEGGMWVVPAKQNYFMGHDAQPGGIRLPSDVFRMSQWEDGLIVGVTVWTIDGRYRWDIAMEGATIISLAAFRAKVGHGVPGLLVPGPPPMPGHVAPEKYKPFEPIPPGTAPWPSRDGQQPMMIARSVAGPDGLYYPLPGAPGPVAPTPYGAMPCAGPEAFPFAEGQPYALVPEEIQRAQPGYHADGQPAQPQRQPQGPSQPPTQPVAGPPFQPGQPLQPGQPPARQG